MIPLKALVVGMLVRGEEGTSHACPMALGWKRSWWGCSCGRESKGPGEEQWVQPGARSWGAFKARAQPLFWMLTCDFRCTDPAVRSSVRAAEEPSPVTCHRGCGALGCVTAALALQTHMMMKTIWCPSILAWWRLRPKAKRRVTQTMTGPSMWSLVRKMTPPEMIPMTDCQLGPPYQMQRRLRSNKLVCKRF